MGILKKLFSEINHHRFYIWYFLRTGNWEWSWNLKKHRFIGPWYTWYDGPHYAFGFWWFKVNLDYFKEDAKYEAKRSLIYVLGRLLNRKDWYEK